MTQKGQTLLGHFSKVKEGVNMKIGVDIGGSHVGIGLINENYKIVDKIERDWTKEEKENLWNNMRDSIDRTYQTTIKK